jgi:hypothetical protein
MDGGFIAWGYGPVTATSSESTIVVYEAGSQGLQQQWLYHAWGYGNSFVPVYIVTGWSVAPVSTGFEVFASDGGQLSYTGDGPALQRGETNPLSLSGGGGGSFATASNGDLVGLVVHEGTTIASLVLSADAGTTSAVATLSSEAEAPAQAVAACTCAGGTFGFAYAVIGGAVMFRQVGRDGTPAAESSTLVTNLGNTATGLAFAPGDGGLLLAVGTTEEIAVFGVACP